MDEKARKVWSKEEIKAGLEQFDKWVVRAVVRLYEKQTQAERNVEQTINKNGVGFTVFDAPVLSGFARQIQDVGGLKSYQIRYIRRKVLKYAGQLAKIANGEV